MQTVTIELNDYEVLVRCRIALNFIKDVAFNTARLNYKDDDLYFDESQIRQIMKLIDGYRYRETFARLRREKEDAAE